MRETIRPYGYAPIGTPCVDSYSWQAKKRTNVIGALYEKMLFALEYVYKNVNWKVMYAWCKYTLIPSLKTKCVIVMDNASFHMSEEKEKHCFARVQDESCARVISVFENFSIDTVIVFFGYLLIVLI